jgi:hypothetical protein
MYRLNGRFSALLVAASLAACGGAQLNQTKLTEVQASVKAAEEVGATAQPQAALHLQLARDEIAKAKKLADDGEEEDAALYLERARADAELALQLARTQTEQQKAQEAWAKIQEFKNDQR